MSKIKFNRNMKKKFCVEYAKHGIMAIAARTVNISTSTVNKHLEVDKWFRELFDEAREEAADILEAEAFRRGHDGWIEPVFDKFGNQVGEIPRYSDKLLSKLMDAARPDKFNTHKTTIEHKGKIDHVHVDVAKQTLLEKLGQMALPNKATEPLDITAISKVSKVTTLVNDDSLEI